MTSVTNLIVRHRFGNGPVVALNAHGDVVPPGLGWRYDPYGASSRTARMSGHVWAARAVSKSDFATYTWTLLALRHAAAQGATIGGTLECISLRRGGGRHRRPEMAARREADQAGRGHCRGLFLCGRHCA